jgi:hypothetical protein
MLEQPCIDRRLAELDLVFQRHDRGQPLGIVGRVGSPLMLGNSRGSWNIALSGGALSHMPHDEQLGYSGVFANYEVWDIIIREERDAWIPLAVLDHPDGLKDADWAMARVAYVKARAASERSAHVGPFMLRSAAMGQKPVQGVAPAQLFKEIGYGSEICQPLLGA